MRFIDLFAGIGGIRLGFENVFGDSAETVFVSEKDIQAVRTYRDNFSEPKLIGGDITEIPNKSIPEFDICLAGFPCQAFSLAGKQKGFSDIRGTMFAQVVRICDYRKPKVIFCENVKNLVNHDKGNTFKIIKESFEKIGYKLFWKVLNSRDFGVPQNRERVYMVAFRCDIAPIDFMFPTHRRGVYCLKAIIENHSVDLGYYLSEKYLAGLRQHKAKQAAAGRGFGYEVKTWMDIGNAVVCGRMGRERNLVIDTRTPDAVNKNKEFIRMLTPRECARMQGFPDDFKLFAAKTHLYKQLGNSVTVPVIAAIAERVKEVLDAGIN